MKPKLKAKWVAALRGGKYLQGKGELVNAERTHHCCVGVLGEVLGIPADDLYKNRDSIFAGRVLNIELSPINDSLKDNGDWKQLIRILADKNDEGESFEKIADYIENNL
jgi:hypothetical protein